jgi:hypothetical protein
VFRVTVNILMCNRGILSQSRQSTKLSLQSSALATDAPPFGSKGWHTLAMGRRVGGSQFGRRDRHSGTLGIAYSVQYKPQSNSAST